MGKVTLVCYLVVPQSVNEAKIKVNLRVGVSLIDSDTEEHP